MRFVNTRMFSAVGLIAILPVRLIKRRTTSRLPMPWKQSSCWTMIKTIKIFWTSMYRVYGLTWLRTDLQETCRLAINFNVENLTRWCAPLVEVNNENLLSLHLSNDLHVQYLGTQSSMRTSKSMPDSNMRKFSKWGSINTDSGISLFSSDTMRARDAMSISSSSSSITTSAQRASLMLPPEATPTAANKMVQQLEDARRFVEFCIFTDLYKSFFHQIRSKRYHQQPPLPQKNIVPPPLPAKNLIQPVPTAATAMSTVPEQTTTVVYSFCDEDVPYRIKIPGRHPPTLKQFKDYLPKKGNYRWVISMEHCSSILLIVSTDFSSKLAATTKTIQSFRKRWATIPMFCRCSKEKLWQRWNQRIDQSAKLHHRPPPVNFLITTRFCHAIKPEPCFVIQMGCAHRIQAGKSKTF